MTQISKLYTNGCSFTNDNYINLTLKQPLYGELIAARHNLIYLNNGFPGSCNRRIIRNTLRDALSFDSSTLVIVQLTLINRTEKSYTPGQGNEWKMNNRFTYQEYHESIKYNPDEFLNNEYHSMYLRYFDEKAAITDLAADLIMLTAFLKNRGIPYYIFSYQPLVSSDAADSVKSDTLQQFLSTDPCVLNILTDSIVTRLGTGDFYYDAKGKIGEIGHLSSAGHILCADLLDNLLINQHAELR